MKRKKNCLKTCKTYLQAILLDCGILAFQFVYIFADIIEFSNHFSRSVDVIITIQYAQISKLIFPNQ